MRNTFSSRLHGRTAPHREQRGVVLIITLIALLILLIGGAALVRSMEASQFLAGNLSFKRDLVNQGERGMALATNLLRTGALSAATTRETNALGQNYSASMLATNAQGVPRLLIDEALFAGAGMAGADFVDATSGVTIRYVIDRQCTTVGAFDESRCMAIAEAVTSKTGSADLASKKAGGELKPIYRISVRVSGPRGTQAYLQSTAAL